MLSGISTRSHRCQGVIYLGERMGLVQPKPHVCTQGSVELRSRWPSPECVGRKLQCAHFGTQLCTLIFPHQSCKEHTPGSGGRQWLKFIPTLLQKKKKIRNLPARHQVVAYLAEPICYPAKGLGFQSPGPQSPGNVLRAVKLRCR